jgi:hypothetical protein
MHSEESELIAGQNFGSTAPYWVTNQLQLNRCHVCGETIIWDDLISHFGSDGFRHRFGFRKSNYEHDVLLVLVDV